MKSTPSVFSRRAAQTGLLPLALALLLPTLPSWGVNKVRVSVTENNGSTTQSSAPAPTKPDKPKPADKTAVKAATPPAKGGSYGSDSTFTHTTNKSLTVSLGNPTSENLDVTVKVTFLAKDLGNKHEIVTEKTLENKMTLAAGKSDQYVTEEVGFTHTAAHRDTPKGGAMSKTAKATNVPASGHVYSGYKVEVFQGSDLIGSTQSSNL